MKKHVIVDDKGRRAYFAHFGLWNNPIFVYEDLKNDVRKFNSYQEAADFLDSFIPQAQKTDTKIIEWEEHNEHFHED